MEQHFPFTQPGNQIRDDLKRLGLVAGQLLCGRYEVRRYLGGGNMGQVIEVHDLKSENYYALKRLPPEVAGNPDEIAKIKANFRLVGQLSHPHICPTRSLETDESAGQAYVVMDLVRGQSLDSWISAQRQALGHAQHPLSVDMVIGIAEQIASVQRQLFFPATTTIIPGLPGQRSLR